MVKKVIYFLLLLLLPVSVHAVNFGFPVNFVRNYVAYTPTVATASDNTTLTSPVSAIYRYTFTASSKTLTLGETGVVDGQTLCIYNVGANSFTLTNDTGSSQTLAQYSEWCGVYQSDRWVTRGTGGTSLAGVDLGADYAWTGKHTFTRNSTTAVLGSLDWSYLNTITADSDFTNYHWTAETKLNPSGDNFYMYPHFFYAYVPAANAHPIAESETLIVSFENNGTGDHSRIEGLSAQAKQKGASGTIALLDAANFYAENSGDVTKLVGGLGDTYQIDGSATYAWGLWGLFEQAAGTTTNAAAVYGLIGSDNGTTTNAAAFWAATPIGDGAGGHFPAHNYGVYVEDQSPAGESDGYGIKIANQSGTGKAIATDPSDSSEIAILQSANTKTLTESSATSFVDVAVASGSFVGGKIEYTINANDASDFQARSGVLPFVAVNKGGTVTCTVGTVGAATEVVAVSAGTLTNTFTCADSTSNSVLLKANAVSSLTQTTLAIHYRVTISSGTATVTPQ